MIPSPYLSPAEVIFRELARPKPPVVMAASVAVVKPLTRDDVTAIIARTRSATAEELQHIIDHAKDFDLTEGEKQQLGLALSILIGAACVRVQWTAGTSQRAVHRPYVGFTQYAMGIDRTRMV